MEENGGQVFGEQAAASEDWAAGGEWGQAVEEQQQQVLTIQSQIELPCNALKTYKWMDWADWFPLRKLVLLE